jgi:hypothetical protein
MKINKSLAFFMCLVSVLLVFFSMFIFSVFKGSPEAVPVGAVLAAIGSLAGLYLAGQVADKGVGGSNYRKELDENNPNRFT